MSANNPQLPGAGVTVRIVRDDGSTYAGVTLPGESYTPARAITTMTAVSGLTASEQARALLIAPVMHRSPREPYKQGNGWGAFIYPDQIIAFLQRDNGSHLSWGANPSLFSLPAAAAAIGNSATLSASELVRLNDMGGAPTPTPTPTPTPVTYVSDDFASPTTVALDGWVPDIGQPWVASTGSPTNGQVVANGGYVTGTTSSGNYYVNPTTLPDTAYEITAAVDDQSGVGYGPGLLFCWSASALTGYRVFYTNNTPANAANVQRFVAGAPTTVGTATVGSYGGTPHVWTARLVVLSDRVQIIIRDATNGLITTFEDTSGSRITTPGYPGLGQRLSTRITAPYTVKSYLTPTVGTSITADGVRTWYNDPVTLVDGSTLYLGSVGSTGTVQVSKTTGGVGTTTALNTNLEVDDHNEASVVKLPGGRLFAAYSKHSSDTVGLRYRVSTNVLPDISVFNTEVLIANGAVATSYTLPFLLNDGVLRVFYRSGAAAERPRKLAKATATSVEAGSASWATSDVFLTTGQRPYMSACQNGADRIDFLMTNGHPNEVVTSIYHVYMQLVGGVETYYKSDGTIIVGLPIDVTTQGTLIDSATGGRCWNWKIAGGPDGQPRVLFTKYPSSTGARDVMMTDIEYWHARWTGSAWVKNRLSTGQVSLYPNENHYAAGMCFDGNDVTTLYLCEVSANGRSEVNKYSFNEATGVKTLIGAKTANSHMHNIRPVSPVGAGRPFEVTWATGRYSTYTSYSTGLFGA